MQFLTTLLCLAIVLLGCSTAGEEGLGSSGTGNLASSTGSGGEPSFGTGGGGPADCAESARLVYVLTIDGDLFSFDPGTLDFIQVGTLECPDVAPHATLFSMSVARDGSAHVLYGDGNLQLVSTVTGHCTSSGYVPEQLGITTFGMGFSSEGSAPEMLFAADYQGSGLAKIDPSTFTMTFVGPFDNLQGSAELTGTGDGRLFGFFRSGAQLAQIDKASGEILSITPLGVTVGSAWAFAFWGGDFWLFTRPGISSSSEVHRYRPSTGITEMVMTAPGMTIVGAGVSTCAPLEPPR